VRLSSSDLCWLAWSLEETLSSDLSAEEETLGGLLSRISAEAPFSPLRSAKEWHLSRSWFQS
jgi:hypothetical protein